MLPRERLRLVLHLLQFPEVVDRAMEIWWLFAAMTLVVPHLPEEQRPDVVARALALADTWDQPSRWQVIGALAPHLRPRGVDAEGDDAEGLGDVAVAPKMSETEGAGKIVNYLAMGLPVVTFDTQVSRRKLFRASHVDAGVVSRLCR